jgi:hypothetical protein
MAVLDFAEPRSKNALPGKFCSFLAQKQALAAMFTLA